MKWFKRIVVVLAVLLIVPCVILFALDHRASAGHSDLSIEINAPAEKIWPWVEEPDKLKQWMSWLVEVRYPDAQHGKGVGATRILVMKDVNNNGHPMQIMDTCTEYAPPARMTAHIYDTEGQFDGRGTYQMVDLGNGRTRMESHTYFHYAQWFANLMEPLITPQADKKMLADMTQLKALVEAQAR